MTSPGSTTAERTHAAAALAISAALAACSAAPPAPVAPTPLPIAAVTAVPVVSAAPVASAAPAAPPAPLPPPWRAATSAELAVALVDCYAQGARCDRITYVKYGDVPALIAGADAACQKGDLPSCTVRAVLDRRVRIQVFDPQAGLLEGADLEKRWEKPLRKACDGAEHVACAYLVQSGWQCLVPSLLGGINQTCTASLKAYLRKKGVFKLSRAACEAGVGLGCATAAETMSDHPERDPTRDDVQAALDLAAHGCEMGHAKSCGVARLPASKLGKRDDAKRFTARFVELLAWASPHPGAAFPPPDRAVDLAAALHECQAHTWGCARTYFLAEPGRDVAAMTRRYEASCGAGDLGSCTAGAMLRYDLPSAVGPGFGLSENGEDDALDDRVIGPLAKACDGGEQNACTALAERAGCDPHSTALRLCTPALLAYVKKHPATDLLDRACAAGLAVACYDYLIAPSVLGDRAKEAHGWELRRRGCDLGDAASCDQMATHAIQAGDKAAARVFEERGYLLAAGYCGYGRCP